MGYYCEFTGEDTLIYTHLETCNAGFQKDLENLGFDQMWTVWDI